MARINTKFKTFIKDRWEGDFWCKWVGRKSRTIKWFKKKTAKKIRKYLKTEES